MQKLFQTTKGLQQCKKKRAAPDSEEALARTPGQMIQKLRENCDVRRAQSSPKQDPKQTEGDGVDRVGGQMQIVPATPRKIQAEGCDSQHGSPAGESIDFSSHFRDKLPSLDGSQDCPESVAFIKELVNQLSSKPVSAGGDDWTLAKPNQVAVDVWKIAGSSITMGVEAIKTYVETPTYKDQRVKALCTRLKNQRVAVQKKKDIQLVQAMDEIVHILEGLQGLRSNLNAAKKNIDCASLKNAFELVNNIIQVHFGLQFHPKWVQRSVLAFAEATFLEPYMCDNFIKEAGHFVCQLLLGYANRDRGGTILDCVSLAAAEKMMQPGAQASLREEYAAEIKLYADGRAAVFVDIVMMHFKRCDVTAEKRWKAFQTEVDFQRFSAEHPLAFNDALNAGWNEAKKYGKEEFAKEKLDMFSGILRTPLGRKLEAKLERQKEVERQDQQLQTVKEEFQSIVDEARTTAMMLYEDLKNGALSKTSEYQAVTLFVYNIM